MRYGPARDVRWLYFCQSGVAIPFWAWSVCAVCHASAVVVYLEGKDPTDDPFAECSCGEWGLAFSSPFIVTVN